MLREFADAEQVLSTLPAVDDRDAVKRWALAAKSAGLALGRLGRWDEALARMTALEPELIALNAPARELMTVRAVRATALMSLNRFSESLALGNEILEAYERRCAESGSEPYNATEAELQALPGRDYDSAGVPLTLETRRQRASEIYQSSVANGVLRTNQMCLYRLGRFEEAYQLGVKRALLAAVDAWKVGNEQEVLGRQFHIAQKQHRYDRAAVAAWRIFRVRFRDEYASRMRTESE